MPPLDRPRHELVAQQIAQGESQRAAYINAGYKGDNIPAVDASASQLLSQPKLINRISELQAEAAVSVKITLEGQIAKLERLLQQAEQLKQVAAAVSAVDKQSELAGLKVQRSEVRRVDAFAEMTDQELDAYLAGRSIDNVEH